MGPLFHLQVQTGGYLQRWNAMCEPSIRCGQMWACEMACNHARLARAWFFLQVAACVFVRQLRLGEFSTFCSLCPGRVVGGQGSSESTRKRF